MTGIEQALRERILLLDGGFATALTLPDEALRDGFDALVLSHPDAVRALHAEYLAAGADIVTTDSFLADTASLAQYSLADRSFDIAARAAELAREAIADCGRQCYAAGSLHPVESGCHARQIDGLIAGGADAILLESICRTDALTDIVRLIRRRSSWIPIIASATTTHLPDTEAFLRALPADELLAIGYNCSEGVRSIAAQVGWLAANAPCAVILYPNSDEQPDAFAGAMEEYLRRGECNIVGGCCGTTPAHTAALATKIGKYSPRKFR